MTTWPIVNLRRVATLGTGHTPSRQHPEYWEDCTVPWLTLADVWQLRDGTKSVITETSEKISELGIANSSAVVHPPGTVAMSRTASVGFSCILGCEMATSQDFVTWTCGPLLDPRFLLHSIRGQRDQILGMRMGSTHQTIYMPDVERIATALPRLDTQRAIADFLDAETARIDALINKKRRLIDTFVDRKASVMLAAVGGALTHRGLFEPSELAWLDARPAHWSEPLLRLLARTGSGHTPSRDRSDWWVDCTIPWITTGEVAQIRSDEREQITETRECLSIEGIANSSATIHPKGTVVLCRTASAGYSAIMGRDMATSQDFATWTCGPNLRPRFLLLCLRAMRADLLGRLATGSTHKTIYMPDIHALRIPLPPLDEQDTIVERATGALRALFAGMEVLRDQLVLLQERRQALITAAVTGQLEIPGVAA